MVMIETIAEIKEDGTLTARAPRTAPRGKRRVVIMIDNDSTADAAAARRPLPDLAEFRESLNETPYPGSSVVDLRREERS